MRLPHFVKTSCGTPSRELFRFGLPAHRHRREGWLGQLDCSWLCHSPHVRFKRRIFSICLFSPTIVLHQTTFVVWSNCASHVQKQKRHRGVLLVGAAGFEPTLTESESGVLPLNYAPMWGLLYIVCVCFAIYFFIYSWGAFNMDNIAAHRRMLGYLKIPHRSGGISYKSGLSNGWWCTFG